MFRHQLMTFLTRQGLISPKLQLLSGHAEERNLAIYRDLALADVAAEYEQAMQSFLVRQRSGLLRVIAAPLLLALSEIPPFWREGVTQHSPIRRITPTLMTF